MKYYNMMIEYALNQSEYLDAAKYYYKVWETPSIKEDEKGRGREVRTSCFSFSTFSADRLIGT